MIIHSRFSAVNGLFYVILLRKRSKNTPASCHLLLCTEIPWASSKFFFFHRSSLTVYLSPGFIRPNWTLVACTACSLDGIRWASLSINASLPRNTRAAASFVAVLLHNAPMSAFFQIHPCCRAFCCCLFSCMTLTWISGCVTCYHASCSCFLGSSPVQIHPSSCGYQSLADVCFNFHQHRFVFALTRIFFSISRSTSRRWERGSNTIGWACIGCIRAVNAFRYHIAYVAVAWLLWFSNCLVMYVM